MVGRRRSLAGVWVAWRTLRANGGTAATRKVLYWVDPMHPTYKSDKPGIAPDCGMALEPVYADDTTVADRLVAAAGDAAGSLRRSSR